MTGQSMAAPPGGCSTSSSSSSPMAAGARAAGGMLPRSWTHDHDGGRGRGWGVQRFGANDAAADSSVTCALAALERCLPHAHRRLDCTLATAFAAWRSLLGAPPLSSSPAAAHALQRPAAPSWPAIAPTLGFSPRHCTRGCRRAAMAFLSHAARAPKLPPALTNAGAMPLRQLPTFASVHDTSEPTCSHGAAWETMGAVSRVRGDLCRDARMERRGLRTADWTRLKSASTQAPQTSPALSDLHDAGCGASAQHQDSRSCVSVLAAAQRAARAGIGAAWARTMSLAEKDGQLMAAAGAASSAAAAAATTSRTARRAIWAAVVGAAGAAGLVRRGEARAAEWRRRWRVQRARAPRGPRVRSWRSLQRCSTSWAHLSSTSTLYVRPQKGNPARYECAGSCCWATCAFALRGLHSFSRAMLLRTDAQSRARNPRLAHSRRRRATPPRARRRRPPPCRGSCPSGAPPPPSGRSP